MDPSSGEVHFLSVHYKQGSIWQGQRELLYRFWHEFQHGFGHESLHEMRHEIPHGFRREFLRGFPREKLLWLA